MKYHPGIDTSGLPRMHTHRHEHPGTEPVTHTHEYPLDAYSCHATHGHRHADGIRHSHPHADACPHAAALPKHRVVS